MVGDNLNSGHRQRLRNKFLKNNNSLEDYELLEMLLFSSNMIKDTKHIAKVLINKFGSLNNVLNASKEELLLVDSVGTASVACIKCVKEIIIRILGEELKNSEINLDSLDKIKNYCKITIGDSNIENMMVLFLSSRLTLIKDEILFTGNSKELKMYNNIIISEATKHGSSNIVLAHNYPSGNSSPSFNDIDTTFELMDLFSMVGMKLVDHIIVSKNDTFSMLENGLFDKMKATKYKNKLLRKDQIGNLE